MHLDQWFSRATRTWNFNHRYISSYHTLTIYLLPYIFWIIMLNAYFVTVESKIGNRVMKQGMTVAGLHVKKYSNREEGIQA